MMSMLLLLQPRGSIMLIENESFCKSYIYLLHVGKYSRQMLSVKLPASCLFFAHNPAKSAADVMAHFRSLKLQYLFILCRLTVQTFFIFNAVWLLVMSNHSNKIRIDAKQMSMLTINPDYLQYLGESLFPFLKFLIHLDDFAMNNTTLQSMMTKTGLLHVWPFFMYYRN